MLIAVANKEPAAILLTCELVRAPGQQNHNSSMINVTDGCLTVERYPVEQREGGSPWWRIGLCRPRQMSSYLAVSSRESRIVLDFYSPP